MKAIVGLGNPEPRYRHTRHNVGWHVLDALSQRWNGGREPIRWMGSERARHAEIVRCNVDGHSVLLVKPQTGMNNSGLAVRALFEKDHLEPDDLLVVYDDIDLALGRIRLRPEGSAGGHNGLRSIQQHLADILRRRRPRVNGATSEGEAGGKGDQPAGAPPFPRLKAGVGRPPSGMDPIDYVLSSFRPDELPIVRAEIDLAGDAAECWLREGLDVAMNRFNGMVVEARATS